MANKKAKKALKKRTAKAAKRALPKKDAKAEKHFHRFLDLWNDHIQEQINVHEAILRGRESLKAHVKRTQKIHREFLKKLSKL